MRSIGPNPDAIGVALRGSVSAGSESLANSHLSSNSNSLPPTGVRMECRTPSPRAHDVTSNVWALTMEPGHLSKGRGGCSECSGCVAVGKHLSDSGGGGQRLYGWGG